MIRASLSEDELREYERRWRRERARLRAELERSALLSEPRDLERCGLPKRHLASKLDVRLIPKRVRDWVGQFPAALADGGAAILSGPPGSGKTATAVWICRSAYRTGEVDCSTSHLRWRAPRIRFVRCGDLFDAVFAKDGDRSAVQDARRVDLLVIDDLGVAYEHEYPLAELDAIIDTRWTKQLATVVTTNLPQRDLEERYPRVWDRLIGSGGPGYVEIVRRSLRRAG